MTFDRGLSSRTKTVLLCTAGLLLGIAAFIPSIVAWFTAEELALIYVVRDDLFAVWSGRGGPGFFRPVIPMIVWAWYHLFGLEPRPYHLLNVVLHVINTCLVYAIARGWAHKLPDAHRLRSAAAAGTAALWFLVWPSHSEPVSWIPALTDVAAAAWGLASLAAYLRYRNGARWPWAAFALLLYAVGLCTKESVITLPAVIFIYEIMRAALCRTLRWKDWTFPTLFFVLMVGYFILRRVLTGVFLGGYGTAVHSNFSWDTLRWTLSPNLANAFLPLPGLNVYQKNWTIPVFALLCLLAIFWRARRDKAAGPETRAIGGAFAIIAMVAAALLAFLPGLNLGPNQIVQGQRFSYLASAFAVISVAYTGAWVLPRGRALPIFAWAVAIACAGLLATYNTSWYRAGKVGRQAVRGMKELPQARRLYVLATTGSYREVPILPHNLDNISKLMLKEPREGEMVMTGSVVNWTPETKVHVEKTMRDGAAGFLVRLEYPGEKADDSPRLDALGGPSEDLAAIDKEGDALYVQPRDFDPIQDKAAWLSGGEWKIVP